VRKAGTEAWYIPNDMAGSPSLLGKGKART
jgi:hypothetical protein